MNDFSKRDDDLIAAAFHGDWNEGDAARFARVAAAHARRRRLHRRILVGAGAASVIVATVLLALHSPTTPVSRPSPAVSPKGYEIISDAELLAQIRDRSVVMVRTPDGRRDFVLVGNE